MKELDYIKPKLFSEVKISEPVETGCCLRSCGGSPYHLGAEGLIPESIKEKFKKFSK